MCRWFLGRGYCPRRVVTIRSIGSDLDASAMIISSFPNIRVVSLSNQKNLVWEAEIVVESDSFEGLFREYIYIVV